MEYRWLEGEELQQLEPILAERGWASLNGLTCRALCAFDGNRLVGFSVVQMFPMLGPFYIDRDHRGTEVVNQLSAETIEFMEASQARGYLAIADSPHTAKLCEGMSMKRVDSPVYLKVN